MATRFSYSSCDGLSGSPKEDVQASHISTLLDASVGNDLWMPPRKKIKIATNKKGCLNKFQRLLTLEERIASNAAEIELLKSEIIECEASLVDLKGKNEQEKAGRKQRIQELKKYLSSKDDMTEEDFQGIAKTIFY